jgi:hypothetical protein
LIATAARGGSRFRGRGARFCGHPGAHDNWVVQRVRGRCEVPDCTCRHYVPDTDKARPANCLIGLLRKRTKRAALNAAPLAQPIYLTNTVADRGTAEPSVMPPASREPPRNCHESVRYRNSHYIFVRQPGRRRCETLRSANRRRIGLASPSKCLPARSRFVDLPGAHAVHHAQWASLAQG